jgi:hypothetical protein
MNNELEPRYKSGQSGLIKKIIGTVGMTAYHNIFLQPRYAIRRKMKKRRDTRLEAEEAEFLVVGWLLVNGIEAHKTYSKMPGYDLIAVNAEVNKSSRIQVKSRYQTGVAHFIIKNFDSDFVVIALLNRGYAKPRKNGDTGFKDPEIYVIPTEVVREAQDSNDEWHKVSFSKIPEFSKYLNNWEIIREALNKKAYKRMQSDQNVRYAFILTANTRR